MCLQEAKLQRKAAAQHLADSQKLAMLLEEEQMAHQLTAKSLKEANAQASTPVHETFQHSCCTDL